MCVQWTPFTVFKPERKDRQIDSNLIDWWWKFSIPQNLDRKLLKWKTIAWKCKQDDNHHRRRSTFSADTMFCGTNSFVEDQVLPSFCLWFQILRCKSAIRISHDRFLFAKIVMHIVCRARLWARTRNTNQFWTRHERDSENPKLCVALFPRLQFLFVYFVWCRMYSFSHSIIRMRWVWFEFQCHANFGWNWRGNNSIGSVCHPLLTALNRRYSSYHRLFQSSSADAAAGCWMINILHFIVISSSLSVLAHAPAIKWFVDTQFMNEWSIIIRRFFLWTIEFHPHFVEQKTQVFTVHARTSYS